MEDFLPTRIMLATDGSQDGEARSPGNLGPSTVNPARSFTPSTPGASGTHFCSWG